MSSSLQTQTVGHNKFSDWTRDEIASLMGLKANQDDIEKMRTRYARFETDFHDEELSWVDRGAITHVRDQGHCGSCWAHAAITSIEAAHFIATDELVQLSTQ